MTKKQAWTQFFTTGDREPLVRAYWDNINYIAWDRFPSQKEDMFQVGMIGLLKALDRIDCKRVKSPDAWVYLNVRGAMLNERQFQPTECLEDEEWRLSLEDTLDLQVDVKVALESGSPEKYLEEYRPQRVSKNRIIEDYHDDKISIREVSRVLGISRRQAYKLLEKPLPISW